MDYLVDDLIDRLNSEKGEIANLLNLTILIEFGPCPIYAHGSSFLPNPGIIMIMMVSRAEIIIIIVNRIISYNCKSDYKL